MIFEASCRAFPRGQGEMAVIYVADGHPRASPLRLCRPPETKKHRQPAHNCYHSPVFLEVSCYVLLEELETSPGGVLFLDSPRGLGVWVDSGRL